MGAWINTAVVTDLLARFDVRVNWVGVIAARAALSMLQYLGNRRLDEQ